MTRHFTDRSYQYIQSWLKNKYKTDPEFKKKKDLDTRFYQMKSRIQKKTSMLMLDVLAECYQTHILT
jgi:ribulose bisphosphate carboxylase small subunit